MIRIIANFVSKFPNFRYHGNKDRFFNTKESAENFFQGLCRDFAWEHVCQI